MDSILIEKAQNGDLNAFEKIVSIYENKVFSIALRYTGNNQDAMDISQEVFVKIYRSIGAFKGDSALSTWIYRVTSNLCIDFIRRDSKKDEVPLEITDSDGATYDRNLSNPNDNPEEILTRLEIQDEIQKCLLLLSDEHREVIILRDIQGFTYEEVSDILDLGEGTVKSRISRARRKLKNIITDRGNISLSFSSKTMKE